MNKESSNAKKAMEIVEKIRKTPKSRLVYRNIEVFANLSAVEFAQIKAELKEILGAKLNLNDFNKAVSEAKGSLIDLSGDLPVIITNEAQLRETTDLCLKALEEKNNPPIIYRRADHLVRLIFNEGNKPLLEIMSRPQLTSVLARAANFYKKTGNALVPDRPPGEVVQDILALGDWPFPFLNGIVQGPVLRADGTILSTPGYDEQSRLYYHPHPDLLWLEVPEDPTEKDTRKSLKLIAKMIAQFPFSRKADKANAVALFLTPIVRSAIKGPVPMAVIDAPVMGSGKTLLATLVALIATGDEPDSLTPPGHQEEEMRKKITSALRTVPVTILMDDVDFTLESRSLSTVLTAKTWQDRLLGTNKHISIPHSTVWMAAGNNIRIGKDLRRRVYWIRLDPPTSRPWRESEFDIKKLKKWVLKRRGRLLVAFLTLARAWFVAQEDQQRPARKVPQFGSFEDWTRVVGGIVGFAGSEDFLENMEAFYDRVDEESSHWEVFLKEIVDKFSDQVFTVKELSEEMVGGLKDYLPPDLEEAFDDSDKSFERTLGNAFARMDGRKFGRAKYQLVRVGMKARAVKWKVTMSEAEG